MDDSYLAGFRCGPHERRDDDLSRFVLRLSQIHEWKEGSQRWQGWPPLQNTYWGLLISKWPSTWG
jgi:hypothetical protein